MWSSKLGKEILGRFANPWRDPEQTNYCYLDEQLSVVVPLQSVECIALHDSLGNHADIHVGEGKTIKWDVADQLQLKHEMIRSVDSPIAFVTKASLMRKRKCG